jgi:hypothetical protein
MPMTTTNSNPFAIGCSLVGALLLVVAVVVHSLTGEFTGLYIFSLALFVVGFMVDLTGTE